jgi:hypothetical protein
MLMLKAFILENGLSANPAYTAKGTMGGVRHRGTQPTLMMEIKTVSEKLCRNSALRGLFPRKDWIAVG